MSDDVEELAEAEAFQAWKRERATQAEADRLKESELAEKRAANPYHPWTVAHTGTEFIASHEDGRTFRVTAEDDVYAVIEQLG